MISSVPFSLIFKIDLISAKLNCPLPDCALQTEFGACEHARAYWDESLLGAKITLPFSIPPSKTNSELTRKLKPLRLYKGGDCWPAQGRKKVPLSRCPVRVLRVAGPLQIIVTDYFIIVP